MGMLRILLIRKTGGKQNFVLACLRHRRPARRIAFLPLQVDYFGNLSLL
jgi:hypothetical protein